MTATTPMTPDQNQTDALALVERLAVSENSIHRLGNEKRKYQVPLSVEDRDLIVRALRSSTATGGREGPWCQPTDCGKPTPRKFIVRFEDPDQGEAHFDNEAEAREFWKRSNTAWTCWLFATLPLEADATLAIRPVGSEEVQTKRHNEGVGVALGSNAKSEIERRIADLQSANAVYYEMDRDTSNIRERNDREIEWLNRVLLPDLDSSPDEPVLGENWQAEAEKQFGTPASGAVGMGDGAAQDVELLRARNRWLREGYREISQWSPEEATARYKQYALDTLTGPTIEALQPYLQSPAPSEAIPVGRDLPSFEDKAVQTAYEILCDSKEPPSPDEHWEGYAARRIVAALTPLVLGGDDIQTKSHNESSGHALSAESKSGDETRPVTIETIAREFRRAMLDNPTHESFNKRAEERERIADEYAKLFLNDYDVRRKAQPASPTDGDVA